MEITGTVVDQSNGAAIPDVTIWEIAPDGQGAQVIGISGPDGKYDVNAANAGSTINFVIDGYQGTSVPASQAALSDQTLLAKDGTISAKLTLSNVPSWVWLVLAAFGIYFVTDKKRK